MKRSISQKLFLLVLGIFLLVLLIQWLFLSRYFRSIYLKSIMDSHQSELSAAIASFSGGDENSRHTAFLRYTNRTGSSILVLTSDHRFGDKQFLERMGSVSLRLESFEEIHLSTIAFEDRVDRPGFYQGDTVHLNAVRLGKSSYYEPLILSLSNSSYTNLEGIHNYKNDTSHSGSICEIYNSGTVSQSLFFLPSQDGKNDTDRFLYRQIRDCLIYCLPVAQTLEKLTRTVIHDSQDDYTIYAEQRNIGGEEYFFLTARQIIVTGQEQIYFNQIFFFLHIFLGIILIITAWGLSRYISNPLIYLSKITQQLAQLDFTQTSHIRRNDELGRLSDSVNLMADSLSAVLDDLRQAGERARDNEVRMQKLLADLAHEFKTPLFIISSYTEALEKGLAGQNEEKYYCFISSEVSRLSELANEVIELSRIHMGTWRVNIEPWDLRDVIQTTLEKFEDRFRAEGFSSTWSAQDATVYMDVRRIEQVLTNLLSNAIKYANLGKRIEVFTRKEGGSMTVYVGNSGIMSETDRARIWDRYYKSGGDSPTRLPGEGIGLDIVRTILQAHGSRYGVEQREEMLYFYFTLDLAEE